MFKIGEFSKLGLVSIKTLRYYDEVGLLKPATIDADSNYRYYTASQLPQLNKILALKNMGLALAQIKQMIDEDITVEEIRGMLRLRQAQIEQQIEAEYFRLKRVEAMLQFVEREGKLPNAETVIKSIPAQHTLTIREPAPGMENWSDLILETQDRLRYATGLKGYLSCLAIFHGNEYDPELVDWELAFPVDEPFKAPIALERDRLLMPRQLPGYEEVATLVHRGSYLTLSQGYSALGHWIEESGYRICDMGREVFIQIDFDSGNENITEIQFPVRKGGIHE